MTVDNTYRNIRAFMSELAGQGVTDVLVSPGSRSTPLAICAHAEPGLSVHIHLDERSAGFWALGMAKTLGRPVALVCTSGTAAANYLPAVIEAHYSEVPLLVLTADRPPELRDRGAGQTIDQLDLYGHYARWWTDLPIPGDSTEAWFRSTAARAVQVASTPRPGPVHLNWPLREPLEPSGDSTPMPAPPIALGGDSATIDPDIAMLHSLAADHERGLVVAGPMSSAEGEGVHEFCEATGWPLLAEPLSQLRRRHQRHPGAAVLAHHDLLVRGAVADDAPEVVVRIGRPMTCKPLRLWLEGLQAEGRLLHHVVLESPGAWTDASTTATAVLNSPAAGLGAAARGLNRGATEWTDAWVHADRTATAVIDEALTAGPLLEAGVVRALDDSLPDGATLYVSNSMPVRDIDTFLRPRADALTIHGNRGASGIDGVVSSAAGAAQAVGVGGQVTLLIGDLALLHDVSGLLAAVQHEVDLTIVVPNNSGGGIFSFLPIAGHDIDFETLFRTPQRHDIGALVNGLGPSADHHLVRDDAELRRLLATPATGLRVLEIPVDREANLAQHRAIAAAVAAALQP